MLTIEDLLKRTQSYFKSKDIPQPRVDAEVLLADLLEVKRIELYMYAKRPMQDHEVDAYRQRVERRANHEPVAYICGSCGFWTLDLQIDHRALIPRPETEHIVDLVMLYTTDRRDHAWRIADVGTGSGALALALASELEYATVLATDISADALHLARENAEVTGLRDRVKFVQADLLSPLLSPNAPARTVDIVVSNPPYVGVHDDTGIGVRSHEPEEALLAGDDGLDVLRQLIPQAARVLDPEGGFFCEFGSSQGEAVRELANECFSDVHIVKDYAGHDRVLVAGEPGART